MIRVLLRAAATLTLSTLALAVFLAAAAAGNQTDPNGDQP